MLNVWTVLWTNGEPFYYSTRPKGEARPPVPESRFYCAEDVLKFEHMVRRRIRQRFTFRCLSNIEIDGIECVPLISDMTGWWPKMELFRSDLPPGRNLYFDLDTLIVGDCCSIIEFDAPFACIKPGKGVGSDQPHKWVDQEGFWRVPRYQTSVMVWDGVYGHAFWKTFSAAHRQHFASDQDFLGELFPAEARMPTEWFTKINRVKNGPRDPIKVVLSMPYRNDEALTRFPWVSKFWR